MAKDRDHVNEKPCGDCGRKIRFYTLAGEPKSPPRDAVRCIVCNKGGVEAGEVRLIEHAEPCIFPSACAVCSLFVSMDPMVLA